METGSFGFAGSAVTPDQNNFCGMGVTANGLKGNSFDTPQLGIRTQVQHLKAYVSTDTLKNECVDPRFKYVVRGRAEVVEWLGQQENPRSRGCGLRGKDHYHLQGYPRHGWTFEELQKNTGETGRESYRLVLNRSKE